MQESRQGRERDFSFLPQPVCACRSLTQGQLHCLYSGSSCCFCLSTKQPKHRKVPASFFLSYRIGSKETELSRWIQVQVFVLFFITVLPKDQQNRGSMCRILFTDSSTWNYFTPPFPKSKTLQVCTGLDCGKNPSLEKHFIQVLPCLPQLQALFLRLQNSFPYIKRWVNTSLWESHIRWLHSHSLMHIHPYIYLEIIPSEFKGGCMGQVKGRARLSPYPASSPISRQI